MDKKFLQTLVFLLITSGLCCPGAEARNSVIVETCDYPGDSPDPNKPLYCYNSFHADVDAESYTKDYPKCAVCIDPQGYGIRAKGDSSYCLTYSVSGGTGISGLPPKDSLQNSGITLLGWKQSRAIGLQLTFYKATFDKITNKFVCKGKPTK